MIKLVVGDGWKVEWTFNCRGGGRGGNREIGVRVKELVRLLRVRV